MNASRGRRKRSARAGGAAGVATLTGIVTPSGIAVAALLPSTAVQASSSSSTSLAGGDEEAEEAAATMELIAATMPA